MTIFHTKQRERETNPQLESSGSGQYSVLNQNVVITHIPTPEFLISFEGWAKLAQKWLMCAPLRIHFEPIN